MTDPNTSAREPVRAAALAAALVGWSGRSARGSRRAYNRSGQRDRRSRAGGCGPRPARPASTAAVVGSAGRARGSGASGTGVAGRRRRRACGRRCPSASCHTVRTLAGRTHPLRHSVAGGGGVPCGVGNGRGRRVRADGRPAAAVGWHSGCHTSPTPEAQASRCSARCSSPASAGWFFALLRERSASLAAPMLAHLATNEAGAVAAIACSDTPSRETEFRQGAPRTSSAGIPFRASQLRVDRRLAELPAPDVVRDQRRANSRWLYGAMV